ARGRGRDAGVRQRRDRHCDLGDARRCGSSGPRADRGRRRAGSGRARAGRRLGGHADRSGRDRIPRRMVRARAGDGRPDLREATMFEGMMVAMVTPFRGGALDLDATARLIEFLIAGGTEGLVISGSTGEAATCTVEERRALWRFAKEQVKGRIPLVAGSGTNSTAESITLTRMAEELGFDGAMV